MGECTKLKLEGQLGEAGASDGFLRVVLEVQVGGLEAFAALGP